MLSSRIVGLVRGDAAGAYPSGREDTPLHVNGRGDLLVAQGMPAKAEIVRMGNSWQVMSAVTAALTAVPTTTAGHSLWNGEADGGKSYIIDSFGTVEVVVDATQQNQLGLFAMMNVGRITAVTDAGLTKASLSGRTAGQTNARTIAGHTVTDAGWFPHGPTEPNAAAVAGGVWRVTEAKVDGLYIVRPGGLFNIAAAKVAATASQVRYFIRWHEVQLPVVS